mgnify:CR=1 FL=1
MAQPEFYSGKLLYPAIVVLIALSALFGLAILPRLMPPGGDFEGQPAPDVTLPIAANGEPGGRMRLSDLRGKVVVLDFWATWCGPCQVQAPILDRVARRYEERGLVVLGINVDDPPELARSFATRKGLSYPILIDDEKRASALYRVDTLPSLVVIDRNGQIASYFSGIVDEGTLDEIIATSL